ncbi:phage tail protein [Niveispirillum sp. SYP-B3756]|uniref:phage tail protein n=1 Tax=Niveispirillum sp. SYP-B3756 TaxID=2662178 RepID=UPI001292033A|nr:phage tail protein [Niveispirillum sp. SYP-B3756]MQP66369.1 phage tail protein [Niveispirillum sp. SYP-B3756]
MTGEVQNDIWPLPKFYFSVQIGSDTVSFQEVTGLDSEARVIEYRHGDSPSFYPIKMPGLGKVSNVTMRKGIFVNDSTLWNWFNQIKMNTISRQTVVINLLDETGTPKMVWTLNNAWPTKVTGTDLKSEGNEVAVESVEVAYETLVISAP